MDTPDKGDSPVVPDRDETEAAGRATSAAPGRTACRGPLTATAPTRAVSPFDDVEAPAGVAEPRLAPQTAIGRYLILEHLGTGGMGVVYKAYDPDLNRQIALKLVRVVEGSGYDPEELRNRLLREAQGLAQLSHPNVVAVHDVGLFEDSIFLAMELVSGPTLREWLKTGPSYRDKLQTFLAAGEGLAAAHRAELIHRDFKPNNVLIGGDGRPRVVDFGLVRAAGGASESANDDRLSGDSIDSVESGASASQVSVSDSLGTPLTRLGTVLGTPRYMSPEQYLGWEIDERSDQFSFCVALYEALYGRKPFRGKSSRALRKAVCSGRLAAPPAGVRLPAHVRRALVKGLAAAATERHPSMAALLAELRRDPLKRWRRAALVLGFLVLAVTAALGLAGSRSAAAQRCQGAESAVARVWDEGVGDSLHTTFLASGRSHATPTYWRVAALLDGYADSWRAMYREACEATWLRGDQSQALLDLRMGCLDRKLQAMAALVDLFAGEPDAEVVDHAVHAVHGLPAIADCAAVDRLTNAEPYPRDPEDRERIHEIEGELDRVRALADSGKPRAALAGADSAVAAAEGVGYQPLLGRALLELGRARAEAQDGAAAAAALSRAVETASASRDDVTAARAAVAMIGAIGKHQRRYEVALGLGPLARALIARAGHPPAVRAIMLNNIGRIHFLQGKHDQALAHFERSLEISRQALGDDNPQIADAMEHIATVRERQGNHEGASRGHREALALKERLLGNDHPSVSISLNNHAIVLRLQGKLSEARAALERSLAIDRAAFGSDSPLIAIGLTNLGLTMWDAGELDDAVEVLEQALALQRKHYGDEHPAIAQTRLYLGSVRVAQGQFGRARPHLESALAALEEARHSPVLITETMMRLAVVTAQTRGCASALPELEAALAVARESLAEQAPTTALILVELGRCQIATGRARQAIVGLEESLATLAAAAPDSLELPGVKLLLSRALWAARKDAKSRRRAIGHAAAARASVAAAEVARPELLAEIDEWLAGHAIAENR